MEILCTEYGVLDSVVTHSPGRDRQGQDVRVSLLDGLLGGSPAREVHEEVSPTHLSHQCGFFFFFFWLFSPSRLFLCTVQCTWDSCMYYWVCMLPRMFKDIRGQARFDPLLCLPLAACRAVDHHFDHWSLKDWRVIHTPLTNNTTTQQQQSIRKMTGRESKRLLIEPSSPLRIQEAEHS